MVLIDLNGVIKLLRSFLEGEELIKMRTYPNRGKDGSFQCKRSHIHFLIEHLVHKLLKEYTRLLVSFIKISVLF